MQKEAIIRQKVRLLFKKLAGSEKSHHFCSAHLQIEGVSGLGLSRYKSSPASFY